jgi:hypothetical protein
MKPKPIEFRSRPKRIIGEQFYIYAGKKWAARKLFLEGCRLTGQLLEKAWSHDLAMPGNAPLRACTRRMPPPHYPETDDDGNELVEFGERID